MFDPVAFGEDIGKLVREIVAPLKDRVNALEGASVELTHEDIAKALKKDPDFMREIVADYLSEHPPPAGKDGLDGKDGKDGAGVKGAMVDTMGELILTLSDGTLQRCGTVVGKDGRDGADLTELDFDYDGERTLEVKAGGQCR